MMVKANTNTAEGDVTRLEDEFAQAVEESRAAKRSLEEAKAAAKAARKAKKRARKALIAAQEAIASRAAEVNATASKSKRGTTDVDRVLPADSGEIDKAVHSTSKTIRKTPPRVRRVPAADPATGSQASEYEGRGQVDSTGENG